MTTSTELIVLSKSNYSESSIVVQCFSRLYGKVGLLVTGVKKKKAKIKSAYFEPLSVLEVHGNFESKKSLVIPKEVKSTVPLVQIQTSMIKRSMAFFISEMLHKSLFESTSDEDAFDFLKSGIEFLNYSTEGISNFHLQFLLKFTRFLGFQPLNSVGNYLDLNDGTFSNQITSAAVYFEKEQKIMLFEFFGSKFDELKTLKLSRNNRKFFLDFIIDYYKVHIPGMKTVKSHHILEEILN